MTAMSNREGEEELVPPYCGGRRTDGATTAMTISVRSNDGVNLMVEEASNAD